MDIGSKASVVKGFAVEFTLRYPRGDNAKNVIVTVVTQKSDGSIIGPLR